MTTWQRLCKKSELSTTQLQKFIVDKFIVLATVDETGSVYVFDAFCPHAAKTLHQAKWDAKNRHLTCLFHWAKFDVSNAGKSISGPTSPSLKVYKSEVRCDADSGEIVYIDLEKTHADFDFLAPNWKRMLENEFQKPYMESLRKFLDDEKSSGAVIYPPEDKIYRALKMSDYNDVRVVILGQDPYHGVNQANGLAFAVTRGVRAPPSLVNIFKEIRSEIDVENRVDKKNNHKKQLTLDSSLEGWANQGVLLLNTVLTVRAGHAFSHRGQGWEQFTDTIISCLNSRSEPIVFILWGGPAQKKESLIFNKQHLILKSPHPSPLSSYRGFFGNNHFRLANEFLQSQSLLAIDWERS